MDETSALRCRNAALETELRLLKEQMAQNQTGNSYLITMLGQQSQLLAYSTQQTTQTAQQENEISSLRLQLDHALQSNAELSNRLFRSRRSASIVEQQEVRSFNGRARALRRKESDDVFVDPGNERARPRAKKASGSRLRFWQDDTDDELERKGEGFGHFMEEIGGASPGSQRGGCVRDGWEAMREGTLIDLDPQEESEQRDGDYAISPMDIRNQGTDANKKSDIANKSIGFESALDQSSPTSMHTSIHQVQPTSADNRKKRRDAYIFKRSFFHHEHNRLAGVATWVEDMGSEDYCEYWFDYGVKHKEHSAAEWRKYYEDVIRPAYLEKMARTQKAMTSGDEERIDSGRPRELKSGEQDSEEDITGAAAKSEGSLNNGDGEDDEDESSEGGELVRFDNAAAPTVTESDTFAQQEQAREGASGTYGGFARAFNSQHTDNNGANLTNRRTQWGTSAQLEEARAFAMSATRSSGYSREFGGDNDLSDTVEVGMARSVSIRSFTKADLKECTLLTRCTSCKRSTPTTPRAQSKSLQSAQSTPKRTPLPWLDPAAQLPSVPNAAALPYRSSSQAFVDSSNFEVTYLLDSNDTSLYRTVLVGNIPPGTTLAEVFDRVEGGRIIRARFADTAGMKTIPPLKTNTALVDFFGARNAEKYEKSCIQKPITFPLANGAHQTAHVSLIRKPSRPVPLEIQSAIHEEGCSRVVYVHDSSNSIDSDYLVSKCCGASGYGETPKSKKWPIRCSEDHGLITLEFAAVSDAIVAYKALCNVAEISRMQKGYLRDPCLR